MKVIDLSQNASVLNQYVAELRDVSIQADPMRFRRNLERIGWIEAYEISKHLVYSQKFVQTPLDMATANTHDDKIVLGTVFRAGLPLHDGFLSVFDRAENAFVSAYRYYKNPEHTEVDVHLEYIATPDLTDKTLLLVDPMLATGESFELALGALLQHGLPKQIHMACCIASKQGVQHLADTFKSHDNITLWCAVIDPELNERKYIVPGLGDAGDLAYGQKLPRSTKR